MSTKAAVAASGYSNTFSIGPLKIQYFNVSLVSGDTSVTMTGDRMDNALFGFLAPGVTQTAAPTYSGSTATFTITDPVATVFCQGFLVGT